MSIETTLVERGKRYGSFVDHARVTQELKDAMKDSPKWNELMPDQTEALEMIQHKVGRILCGDPDYHDSWHDIVGYAKLVADRLEAKPEPPTFARYVILGKGVHVVGPYAPPRTLCDVAIPDDAIIGTAYPDPDGLYGCRTCREIAGAKGK